MVPGIQRVLPTCQLLSLLLFQLLAMTEGTCFDELFQEYRLVCPDCAVCLRPSSVNKCWRCSCWEGMGEVLPGEDKEPAVQEIKQNPPSGMERVISWSDQPQTC